MQNAKPLSSCHFKQRTSLRSRRCLPPHASALSPKLLFFYHTSVINYQLLSTIYNNAAGYNFLHSHNSNAAAALLYVSYIDLPQVLRRCARVWALAATCAWELCSKFEKSVWSHLQKQYISSASVWRTGFATPN